MQLDGEWINQNGSRVVFALGPDGDLGGHYLSAKGRAAAATRYPLQGRVNGELVAFQVDWRDERANLHAITSFTGRWAREADGGEVLHTVWVLARQFENEAADKPTQVWNSFLTNADVFRRVGEGG